MADIESVVKNVTVLEINIIPIADNTPACPTIHPTRKNIITPKISVIFCVTKTCKKKKRYILTKTKIKKTMHNLEYSQ